VAGGTTHEWRFVSGTDRTVIEFGSEKAEYAEALALLWRDWGLEVQRSECDHCGAPHFTVSRDQEERLERLLEVFMDTHETDVWRSPTDEEIDLIVADWRHRNLEDIGGSGSN
jgi:hypothetical protein